MAANDTTQSQDPSQVQRQQRSQQQQANTSMEQGQSYQGKQTASADPRGRTVKDLKGTDVVSSTGEKLGDIDDFVIEAQTGKIAFAVVGAGGVLGVGEKLHAVPFSALKPDMNNPDQMTLANIDKAKWQQAPTFKRDQVASLSQQGSELGQFYGVQVQQAMQTASQKIQQAGQKVTGQGTSMSSQYTLASKIIGSDVRSGQQEVGEIEDVLVQSRSGNAAVVLDADDSFAGSDQKYIVPFKRFTQAGDDRLNTSLTREDLAKAQTVNDDSWATGAEGAMGSVFVYAQNAWNRTKEATANAADRVSREARDTSDNINARRTSQSGQAPVEAIRQAVQQTAGSSAQKVQVTTSGNKIILSGTVPSDDLKDKIEDRAEKAAQGWNIDNQIRVSSADE